MSRMNRAPCLILGLVLSAGGPAGADVWDNATETDDSISTDNRLIHGSVQVHDLAAPGGVQDQDFYFLSLSASASYEVMVDGWTGDLDFSTGDIVRMDSNGNVVQDALVSSQTMVVRWKTGPFDNFMNNYIRVRSSNCGTGCKTSDQYTIRFRETTYAIPRFNNSGSQTTILIVNSLGSSPCTADFLFFNTSGTLLGTSTHTIDNGASLVLNTATLPFASSLSGMVKVLHTCPYGTLTGKAVSVEVTTGFTFDTLMVPIPY